MVIAAARSIEKQLRLIRRNKEMSVYTGFLDNVLESAETGLLALDNDLRIWKTNRKAKRILNQENLAGKPISVLKGLTIDLENLYQNPDIWKEKECHLKINKQDIHLVLSAQPVISKQGRRLGAVLVFEEFSDIRKIVDKISESKAYFTFDHLIGASPAFCNAIEDNRFRQDLYYRLNILRIKIPPLRERGEKDIKRLAAYFLKKFDPQCNFTPDAITLLKTYDWPGNVRELENTIERAFHISDGEQLKPKHLGSPLTSPKPICARSGTLREMEKEIILSTLKRTRYNMAETAKVLGISRATLYRKVKAYKLVKASYSEASDMSLPKPN
jgi:transcriptional regulator with PAS, ATPase and Fis domain